MKSMLLFLLLLFFSLESGFSQTLNLAKEFRFEESRAMYILLGWSGLSLAGSGILAANGKKDQAIMHASWAVINAGIASFALMSAKPELVQLADYLSAEKSFNQILALNTGLDVAYVSTGLLMNYYGKSLLTKEFGTAIAIQGSFLLVFDAVLFWQSNERLNRGFELISSLETVDFLHTSEQVFQVGFKVGLF